jgi:hypothetical protein
METGVEMELDAFVSLFTERADKVDKGLHGLKRKLPVRKTLGATVTGTGAATTLLEIPDKPAVGRVWNILTANLDVPALEANFATPATASGNVTAPAGSTAIANIPPASLIPGAEYVITWNVSLNGTVTTADGDNMRLNVGSVFVFNAQYPGVNGFYPMPTITMPYPVNDAVGIRVRNAAAGSASAIYGAMIVAQPASGSGITADIFAGPPFDQYISPQPIVPDRIALGQSLPATMWFPRRSIWLHSEERLYALVYGLPLNDQAVLTVRVAEYPLTAEEATQL